MVEGLYKGGTIQMAALRGREMARGTMSAVIRQFGRAGESVARSSAAKAGKRWVASSRRQPIFHESLSVDTIWDCGQSTSGRGGVVSAGPAVGKHLSRGY